MGSLGLTAMALLQSKVLSVTVSAPVEVSSMPPPNPPPAALPRASLPVTTQLLMLKAALPASRMPPPSVARPSVMVSPEMVTLALPLMLKTWLELLPLTDNLSAPGPLIVTLFVIGRSLFSVMVPCSPLAKSMVSPLLASAMADRNEPAPLSDRLYTVKVLSKLLSSSPSRRGRTDRRERVGRDPERRDRVGEPEVNRRIPDANIMMRAFLEGNRSAKDNRSPGHADPLPG